MEYVKPEAVGISSESILSFIKKLDASGLSMHSVIIARHGKICYEGYWKPFNEDFAHRIYSVTKSFVSIAVGFLIQDGSVSLDDKILKHFPDMEQYVTSPYAREQTIRDMLMMATAKDGYDWFSHKPEDRVKDYFETTGNEKTSGTLFSYDSSGSFVLGALVERISKQSFLEFLRERLFDKIGMSDNIECLKCPGGYAWGDSALIMTPGDLLKFAMFVMNKGRHKGEQILDEAYITEATKKQVDNNFFGTYTCNNQGYGYLIWRTYDNSFAFLGMGNQDVICVPDKDLIFVCNAGNQGIDYSRKLIFDSFFELVARQVSDVVLEENIEGYRALSEHTGTLKLSVAKGEVSSPYARVINGKTFALSENRMGISDVKLSFSGDNGTLEYNNNQGHKTIRFGMCENIYQDFPQTGYSDECAVVRKEGHKYKCAVSAAWVEERKLYIKVQIIDKYFGNLHIVIGFTEAGKIGICMKKSGEDFLGEYYGYASDATVS